MLPLYRIHKNKEGFLWIFTYSGSGNMKGQITLFS